MRFPNIGLLFVAALGLTQALVLPTSSAGSTAIEHRDASAQLGRVMARAAYKCPLKDPKKCTTCGKVTLTKGPKPKPLPCKKGTKGCKRDRVDAVEKRAPSVGMDSTAGTAWAAGDKFGTTGLGSCSFIVIFDDAYILGAHIPPARAATVNGVLQLVNTGREVIDDHLQRIDRLLPNVRGPRNCILVTATSLDPAELNHMRQQLAARGLRCTERPYDPTRVPQGGIFVLNRPTTAWPPQVVGPL